jgi:hypothetical protein
MILELFKMEEELITGRDKEDSAALPGDGVGDELGDPCV